MWLESAYGSRSGCYVDVDVEKSREFKKVSGSGLANGLAGQRLLLLLLLLLVEDRVASCNTKKREEVCM